MVCRVTRIFGRKIGRKRCISDTFHFNAGISRTATNDSSFKQCIIEQYETEGKLCVHLSSLVIKTVLYCEVRLSDPVVLCREDMQYISLSSSFFLVFLKKPLNKKVVSFPSLFRRISVCRLLVTKLKGEKRVPQGSVKVLHF